MAKGLYAMVTGSGLKLFKYLSLYKPAGMRWYYLVIIMVFGSCAPAYKMINYTVDTKPQHRFESFPEKIVLLNSCNIAQSGYRDNKEELFMQLLDTVLYFSASELNNRSGIASHILPGFTAFTESGDSSIYSLIQVNNATHAVAVTSFDTYFYQREVEVTRDSDGKKNREAYYDIISTIHYRFYNRERLIKETTQKIQRKHSSRNVIISFLAAGPNIVSNRDDALNMTKDNVVKFMDHYFPGKAPRSRPVFIKKELAAVGAALANNDYEAAMIESLRLAEDGNNQVAAKANYNCAVFMERKNQPEEAIKYLETAQRRYFLREAYIMLNELDNDSGGN